MFKNIMRFMTGVTNQEMSSNTLELTGDVLDVVAGGKPSQTGSGTITAGNVVSNPNVYVYAKGYGAPPGIYPGNGRNTNLGH